MTNKLKLLPGKWIISSINGLGKIEFPRAEIWNRIPNLTSYTKIQLTVIKEPNQRHETNRLLEEKNGRIGHE